MTCFVNSWYPVCFCMVVKLFLTGLQNPNWVIQKKNYMKKILVLFIATSLSYGAFAQATSNKNQDKMMTESKDMMNKNFVMMKDDKMMVCKNGETMPMTKEIKLKNSTTVMPDGSVKTKEGKTIQMKNGEAMDMKGNMTWMKDDKMMDEKK